MRGSMSSTLSQHQRHTDECLCERERQWQPLQWKQRQGGLKPHKTPEKEVVEETSTHKRVIFHCKVQTVWHWVPCTDNFPILSCTCVRCVNSHSTASESNKPMEGLFLASFASKLMVFVLSLAPSWMNCVTGGCKINLAPSAQTGGNCGSCWKQKSARGYWVIGKPFFESQNHRASQAGRDPQGLSLPTPEL